LPHLPASLLASIRIEHVIASPAAFGIPPAVMDAAIKASSMGAKGGSKNKIRRLAEQQTSHDDPVVPLDRDGASPKAKPSTDASDGTAGLRGARKSSPVEAGHKRGRTPIAAGAMALHCSACDEDPLAAMLGMGPVATTAMITMRNPERGASAFAGGSSSGVTPDSSTGRLEVTPAVWRAVVAGCAPSLAVGMHDEPSLIDSAKRRKMAGERALSWAATAKREPAAELGGAAHSIGRTVVLPWMGPWGTDGRGTWCGGALHGGAPGAETAGGTSASASASSGVGD